MSAQLRKSPSCARMAETMARSGKLRCFLASLPAKIWWSRALVASRPGSQRQRAGAAAYRAGQRERGRR